MIGPLKILFEDEHLLAINKDHSTHSVMQPNSIENSVAFALSNYLKDAALISPKKEDSGLVQRLDYETSGVIIAAKSREVWELLHRAPASNSIQKTYLSLVEGHFPNSLKLENLIGASGRHSKKVRVFTKQARSKFRCLPAETSFQLLKFFKHSDLSLIEANIHAGRRHQLRAHAAFAGHPLIGDTLYGSTRSMAELDCSLNCIDSRPNFFLHARRLKLQHPKTLKTLLIEAPLPEWINNIKCLSIFSHPSQFLY